MSDTSLSPSDSETIAAFLDQRLSEEERRAFIERLDREPALYEVFVETVRYRESQEAGAGAEVVEHPSRRGGSWMIPGAVAAMLAIAVFGPFLIDEASRHSGLALARDLVEGGDLEAVLEPDWYEQGWRRTRGLTPLRSDVDSAFRVGVHTVDLEVALRLGREEEALRLLRYIDRELGNVDSADRLRQSFGEMLRRAERGVAAERLVESLREAEPLALELPVGHGYAFGTWAEAGKLAARSRQEDLLRSRQFLQLLESIRDHAWTEVVDQRLDEIETMISALHQPIDPAALEEAFTAIIDES